jgi:catechol 2,3-dioxygenase-like lactoylglutathione lyase family enzyme
MCSIKAIGAKTMLRYSQTRLLVSSMAESVRFYRDTLGLPIAFGGENDVYSDFSLGEGITLGLFGRTHMAASINAELHGRSSG